MSVSSVYEDSLSVYDDGQEVRTLFVSGLPMDAKPRELYLLFRAYKGYEGSLLKVTGKNGKSTSGVENNNNKPPFLTMHGKVLPPVGFVTFSSRCAAEAAKQDLQGVRFDPDLPQTLRLEFAKSNTKVTKPKQQSPQPAATHPTLVHPITGQELGAAFFPGMPEGWAAHPLHTAYTELSPAALHHPTLIQHPALAQAFPQALTAGYNNQLQLQTAGEFGKQVPSALALSPATPLASLASVGNPLGTPAGSGMLGGGGVSPLLGSPLGSSPSTPQPSATTGKGPNAPCSTLFVANLGPFCSEQELKDLFASFPGFSRLRMHNKGGSPVAFVEFQDLRLASEAAQRLQGFVLLSSGERGGIRIEYAKQKMGETRRDDLLSPPMPLAISTNGY